MYMFFSYLQVMYITHESFTYAHAPRLGSDRQQHFIGHTNSCHERPSVDGHWWRCVMRSSSGDTCFSDLETTHLFDVCAGLSKHGRLAQKWRHDACLFPMSIGKMNLEWCFKPLQSKCTRSTLWTNPIRRCLNGWGEDSEERDLATWSPPIRIEQPELTLL